MIDKKKADEKVNNENAAMLNRESYEIDNWIKFLQTVFRTTNIEHFGLLLHWYSKGVDNENIKIANRKIISYKSLTALDLKTLHEDILLYVGK